MPSKKRYETIHLKKKEKWECARGHEEHISGSGEHDSRPKRSRTRKDIERKWRQEYDL